MSPPEPRYREYAWRDGHEWMLELGPENGPRLLILPPLLEELNRSRKLLTDMMRDLAVTGILSVLPDLPGTGESLRTIDATDWDDWRDAMTSLVQEQQFSGIFSLRGGCLLDDCSTAKAIRFAPVAGKNLIRDLIRARGVTDKGFDAAAQKAVFETGPTMLGGYPVPVALARALRDADLPERADVTTGRLESDLPDADFKIDGTPVWRRAEPSGSPELSRALADKIAAWII